MGDKPQDPGVFGPMLLDFWNQRYEASGRDNRPMSKEGARFRHSWAGWCARKIQYSLQQHEGSREFTVPATPPADRWRMEMGTLVHDYWQAALKQLMPAAQLEHVTSHQIGEAISAGHGDAMLELPKFGKVCVELKSRNGYGYKQDIGANKNNEPEGPSWPAKIQGALNAKAEDADWLVVLHISLEAVGPNQMPAPHHGNPYHPLRIIGEWWYDRDEYTPWAERELARAEAIVRLTDEGKPTPRHVPEDMPSGARIVDPAKAQWSKVTDGQVVGTGQLWYGRFCDYCPFQETCIEDGE